MKVKHDDFQETSCSAADSWIGYFIWLAKTIFWGLKWFVFQIFVKPERLNMQELHNRKGHVAVLTGGTRGIGAHVLRKLLECELKVVAGCRDIKKGAELLKQIRKDGIKGGDVQWYQLDLESFASVRTFAAKVLNAQAEIHLLINNAGIWMQPYKLTEDGCESHWQINYFSHVLLTELLLPRMTQTAKDEKLHGRVVFTSSVAQYAGDINFADLHFKKWFSELKASLDCKTAHVTYCAMRNEQLVNEGLKVRIYSIHPGVIPTDMVLNNFPRVLQAPVTPLVNAVLNTVDEGAETVIHAALSPEIENQGGSFLLQFKKADLNPIALNTKFQHKLWTTSQQTVGLPFSKSK